MDYRRNLILMASLVIGLCGRATTAKYDAKFSTYVGATEEDIVANRGIPNKTYALDNGKKAGVPQQDRG